MKGSDILGKRIHQRRELLQVTAYNLAQSCGLSPATIYRVEKGGIGQLGSDALVQIANELKTTVDYLLGRTNDPTTGGSVNLDPQAAELLQLSAKLKREDADTVAKFMEFLRYRALPIQELIRGYNDLYEMSEAAVKTGKWDKKDKRLLKAREQQAMIAINLALTED